MTDQATPQSYSGDQPDASASFRGLLVQISQKVDDTQASVKSLQGRMDGLEGSLDQRIADRSKLLKTDLEAKIIAETTERRIEAAYQKAKYELYDVEIRNIKDEFKEIRGMLRNQTQDTNQRFDTVFSKIDSLSDNVASLQVKISAIVGIVVVVIEVATKVLPELLK